MELFAFLAIEEFLMKKNMPETLSSFRQEWLSRPDEATSMMTWYDLALKLRLPDLIAQSNKGDANIDNISIVEHVVSALVKESSVRSRRAPEVIVNGLATLPQAISLPQLISNYDIINEGHLNSPSNVDIDYRLNRNQSSASKFPVVTRESGKDQNHLNNSKELVRMGSGNKSKFSKKKSAVHSEENWIPEVTRMGSIARDIQVAKESMSDIIMREITAKRELKRFLISPLETAKIQESLGTTKKKRCSCCLQKFLYCNLPLKVSQKAILDIRIKWTGGLNSDSIFNNTASNEPLYKSENFSASWMEDFEKSERLKVVPRCYDEVWVCFFCAQFFQRQESYRPSYQQIVAEEEATVLVDQIKRETQYWDPLKMMEKDKEREREHERFLASANVPGGFGGEVDMIVTSTEP